MTSIVDCCEERILGAATTDRMTATWLSEDAAPSIVERMVKPKAPTTRFGGVSVIVPCFNEQDAIASTLRQLSDVMLRAHRPYELLVVDDGSTDATPHELSSCVYEPFVRVIRNDRNRGYGYSLKRAIAEAQYETVLITDADGTYPLDRIPDLLAAADGTDMLVAARTGVNVAIPLFRRPAKWVLRKLAAYLTQTEIPDLNSGMRVMKRGLVKRFLPLLPDGFSFTTTITLASLTHGCVVRYVPIDYARRVGQSSIRPIRDTLNFLSLIVRTVMYFRPLKVFAPVSAVVFAGAIGVAVVTKFAFGQLADVTSVTLAMAAMQLLAIGLVADLIDKRSPSFS